MFSLKGILSAKDKKLRECSSTGWVVGETLRVQSRLDAFAEAK